MKVSALNSCTPMQVGDERERERERERESVCVEMNVEEKESRHLRQM